jgi:hypothetical protein
MLPRNNQLPLPLPPPIPQCHPLVKVLAPSPSPYSMSIAKVRSSCAIDIMTHCNSAFLVGLKRAEEKQKPSIQSPSYRCGLLQTIAPSITVERGISHRNKAQILRKFSQNLTFFYPISKRADPFDALPRFKNSKLDVQMLTKTSECVDLI